MAETGVTVAAVVERAIVHLRGHRGVILNRLASDLPGLADADTVSLAFTPAADLVPGMVIGLEYETLYTWDVDGFDVTVQRGHDGSTVVEHDTGAILEIGPRWTRWDLLQTFIEEVRSWRSDLFEDATVEVTVEAGVDRVSFDAAGGRFKRVLRAELYPSGTSRSAAIPVRVIRNAPVSVSASGVTLQLDTALPVSGVLVIDYAEDYDLGDVAPDADLGDLGIQATFADIAAAGIAARCLLHGEAPRTDHLAQGQPRNAEEVPPQANIQTGDRLWKWRNSRIADEAKRLLEKYGMPEA